MPELPEVEVVRRGLEPHVSGRLIQAVEVNHDRSVRRHPGGANDFRAVLTGRRIESVRRRGKYLWWALDDGDAVVAHLGMSGQFRVGTAPPGDDVALPSTPMSDEISSADEIAVNTDDVAGTNGVPGPADRHPHLRIRFTLADPAHPQAPPSTVDFLDQRTFGGMAFAPGGADLPEVLAHIARDPLDPEFDLDRAVAAIRAKRSEIKRVLLDQTVVSGIGNIYADEALWAARLHYARPTATMTRAAAAGVITAATEVMTSALAVGGTSFDALYVNVDGESGYFARSLHAYGRAGQPCDRCGTPLRRDAFMNRSSFFCPQCQRPPRAPRRAAS